MADESRTTVRLMTPEEQAECERLTRELDAEIDAELGKPENVARRLARQARRARDRGSRTDGH
jgi:hypothetical protein